jgi:hypothetical protein
MDCPGTRFELPDLDWNSSQTIKDDLFTPGGTVYNIPTGERPYQELPLDECGDGIRPTNSRICRRHPAER